MKVNLGEKKTKCRTCGLWTPAGKKCMWCGSIETSKPMVKILCTECRRVTYVDRAHIYEKLTCAWCGSDISVVKK